MSDPMSDDELDALLEAANRTLLAITERALPSPRAATRLAEMLGEIFPEWEISCELRPGSMAWCARLRRELTAPMRQAGILRNIKCTTGTRLADALMRQMEIFASLRAAG
ncbi:hypothetical protein [Nonomuraea insulae]|uniref:DUF222 domain-containing protein n=1 Tax=Nonomuraea insulae TaxID=1616787 RepID=A0ABW1DBX8_9ACTN